MATAQKLKLCVDLRRRSVLVNQTIPQIKRWSSEPLPNSIIHNRSSNFGKVLLARVLSTTFL